jgi:hypothetical protein
VTLYVSTSSLATVVTAPTAVGDRGDVGAEGVGAATSQDGRYVASKNGSAYHLPWCSGAARIKEENKIWFATKEEAEAAGYRAASNCKGI